MEYILGRDKNRCGIVIDDQTVSGVHAKIKRINNKLFIEDLGSTNGTFVDKVKIQSPVLITPKSEIILGKVQLVINPDGSISYHKQKNIKTPPRVSPHPVLSQIDDSVNAIVGELVIGRNKECNIHIDHINASREHAKLYSKNGGYYISDLRSTNGTFVNGHKISKEYELKNGDSIMVANVELHYRDGSISQRAMFTAARNRNSANGPIAIKVDDLCKTFTNGFGPFKKSKTVLNNISTEIRVGEFVVILGTSGAGKSVFMSCLNGSETVPSQTITYADTQYTENEGFRQCIGAYVPQDDIIYRDLSVERCLYHSLKLKSRDMKYSDQEMQNILDKVLDMVNLAEHKETLVRKLSGGQRKRVSIAQEFLSDPDLIFLDEPTSGLDPGTEYSLMDTFSKMTTKKDKTVIMVTHDIANIDLCDRIIILGTGGYLCYSGSYEGIKKFFNVQRIGEIYPLIETTAGAQEWSRKFSKYSAA